MIIEGTYYIANAGQGDYGDTIYVGDFSWEPLGLGNSVYADGYTPLLVFIQLAYKAVQLKALLNRIEVYAQPLHALPEDVQKALIKRFNDGGGED
jgi:hypothetical protein